MPIIIIAVVASMQYIYLHRKMLVNYDICMTILIFCGFNFFAPLFAILIPVRIIYYLFNTDITDYLNHYTIAILSAFLPLIPQFIYFIAFLNKKIYYALSVCLIAFSIYILPLNAGLTLFSLFDLFLRLETHLQSGLPTP